MKAKEMICCPRCRAEVEQYQPAKWQTLDWWVIRAHKDPTNQRSCWAGGKRVDQIEDMIAAHHVRMRKARISAGVEFTPEQAAAVEVKVVGRRPSQAPTLPVDPTT